MSGTRPTTSVAGRVLSTLLGVGVVSVVLGIVAMHTLNPHGVMSNAEHTTALTGQMTGYPTHLDPGMGAGDEASVVEHATGAVVAAPAGGIGHGMGDMVMLCIAILASAAGALLLLLASLRRTPRVWAPNPGVPSTLPRWFAPRLGTGPPSVWEFSVIRC